LEASASKLELEDKTHKKRNLGNDAEFLYIEEVVQMLISTQRTLALRCPLCGKMEFDPISWFDFSGKDSVQIKCKCGFNKLIINSKNNYRDFYFQIPCLICDEVHIIKFSKTELWGKINLVLRCTTNGQELGYIGSKTAIEKLINQKRDDLDSVINNLGFDDYFTNPQVMYEILNHLHQLADSNQLFCHCGNNQIDIEVFPEKLELHCSFCQSLHIIYAETIEDLRIVKEASKIALTEKGFSSFDSSKVHPV